MPTTSTGCSTSGIWLTRSFASASRPRPISVMMMTIAATGRLMLKSERNMGIAFPRSLGSGRRRDGRGGGGGLGELDVLAIHQGGARRAQQAIARDDALDDHHLAAARIALAEGCWRLPQPVARDLPHEGLVAFLGHHALGQQQRRRLAHGDA